MGLFTYIIIGLVAVIIWGVILNTREAKRMAKKATKQLSKIDNRYGNFIEKRINMSIIKNDSIDIDKEKLIDEALIILKPHIDGLIAHINSTTNDDISINYSSPYFDNIISIMEEKYVISAKNKDKILSEKDEKEIFEAFSDAINADISDRMVNLKSLNF